MPHFSLDKYFCSTSLPLVSTRWVRLTSSSICPLFKAVPSINLSNIKRRKPHREKFFGMPRIEPGAAGCKARMLAVVLCGPQGQILIFTTFT